MMTKRIYVCRDNIEGILSGIYDAWSSRYGHDNIKIQVKASNDGGDTLELFSEYIDVLEDQEKAMKVVRAIIDKISEEAYDIVRKAVCSCDRDKGDIIYRFLILGFHIGSKVTQYLGNDSVMRIFSLNRNVNNEVHYFLGFVRFTEIEYGILYSKINPKNDVIRLIAPHFSDRMNAENFIIVDEHRETAIVHRSGYPWVYTYGAELNVDRLKNYSEQEDEYRNLWKTFFDSISIKERENYRLQNNNLPKRFRSNMLEFDR